MQTLPRLSLSFALAAVALPAQTFVDAQRGAGSSFTSVQAAVAAVPSGSTLLVRPS